MTAIRKHLADFIAIVLLFVLALGVAGYVLSNQRLRFPLIQKKPFTVKAVLPDAQAVQPGQGQTVRVAGVEIGQIGKVKLENGRAVVDLQLKPKYKGFVRQDATALLRSKTGLKDMFIEVDPGEGKPLKENGRLQVRNTLPDIDPDEILSALDSDTRDYLTLLITGAGKGLKGRGSDLREALARLGPLHKDLARVSQAIASRRQNLRRLIHNYSLLVDELGGRGRDLTRLVQASNAVFQAFASEDRNVSAFVQKLPGTLGTTRTTLAKADRLALRLRPALNALRPPFRNLDTANRESIPFFREATPIVRDQIRPFAREGRPFIRDLGRASSDLAKAGPDLRGTFRGLNRLFNIAAYNPKGAEGISSGCASGGGCTTAERNRQEGYLYWLAWTGQNTVSLFNTSDAMGPFRRFYLGGLGCNLLLAQLIPIQNQLESQLPPALVSALPNPAKELPQRLIDTLGSAGVCAK